MSGPKEIGVRGCLRALVVIQKVISATASISQAKNPGSVNVTQDIPR